MSADPAAVPTDRALVIGVDFGTLSGRAVVVRASDGTELGSAVHDYDHGVLDHALPDGRPLRPDWALQNPQDYRDVLRYAVPAAVTAAGLRPARDLVGIGIDFTACTVLPTLADGTPLCETPDSCATEPHTWVKLWKHHAAQPHADRINALAPTSRPGRGCRGFGGKISAEWQFAKALQIFDEDPQVYQAREHFVEAADWIVWQLCGTDTRNVCAPATRASCRTATIPPSSSRPSPQLRRLRDREARRPVLPLGDRAGALTAQAAAWTGLPEGIPVAVGNVDAHVTAAAARRWSRATGRHHGHLHLPRGELRRSRRGARDVRRRRRRNHAGRGDTRPARAASATSSAGWSTTPSRRGTSTRRAGGMGLSLHAHLTELAGGQPVGEHGLVRWTGTAATVRCWSTTNSSGNDRRHDPGHTAPGHLPGAVGGHRVRHPDDRRGVRGLRGRGRRDGGRRRAAPRTGC